MPLKQGSVAIITDRWSFANLVKSLHQTDSAYIPSSMSNPFFRKSNEDLRDATPGGRVRVWSVDGTYREHVPIEYALLDEGNFPRRGRGC